MRDSNQTFPAALIPFHGNVLETEGLQGGEGVGGPLSGSQAGLVGDEGPGDCEGAEVGTDRLQSAEVDCSVSAGVTEDIDGQLGIANVKTQT